MHGQDQRGAAVYPTSLQRLPREVTRFDHRFAGEERKSLSLDQYCRYPANSLNHLNLWPRASRTFSLLWACAQGFRACPSGRNCCNERRAGSAARPCRVEDAARAAGLPGELERCQAFPRRGDGASISASVCAAETNKRFELRRRRKIPRSSISWKELRRTSPCRTSRRRSKLRTGCAQRIASSGIPRIALAPQPRRRRRPSEAPQPDALRVCRARRKIRAPRKAATSQVPARIAERVAGERARLVDTAERRDAIHDFAAATVGRDRQSAADDFSKIVKSGSQRRGLSARRHSQTETGNHFVEDQQSARAWISRRPSETPAQATRHPYSRPPVQRKSPRFFPGAEVKGLSTAAGRCKAR